MDLAYISAFIETPHKIWSRECFIILRLTQYIIYSIILSVDYQNQSIDILQVHYCLFIRSMKFIKEREPIFHSFVPLQNDLAGKKSMEQRQL